MSHTSAAPPLSIDEVVRPLVNHKHRQLAPRFRHDVLTRMIAAWGAGPDPCSGERLVAFFPLTRNDQVSAVSRGLSLLNPAKALGRHLANTAWDDLYGAMVTDRAVVLRGSGTTVRVPYDRIAEVEASSGATVAVVGYSAVYLRCVDGTEHVVDLGPKLGKPMVTFLRAVISLREEGQLLPPSPWPTPTDDDQLGIRAAEASLPAVGPRVRVGLDALHAAADALPEGVAADAVARFALHGRFSLGGRGQHDGFWVTALPMEVLERFLDERGHCEALDAPDSLPPLPPGARRVQLVPHPQTTPDSWVLTRGLAKHVFNDGTAWVDLRTVEVDGRPMAAFRSFVRSSILRAWTPHHEVAPTDVAALHEALSLAEARWLLRVAALPHGDLNARLATPDDEVLLALQRLTSPIPPRCMQVARLPVAVPAPAPSKRPLPPQLRTPTSVATKDDRPNKLIAVAIVQLVGGIATTLVGWWLTWFVVAIPISLFNRLLSVVPRLNEDLVTGPIALLALIAVMGQLAMGPLRFLVGLLLLAPLRLSPKVVQGLALLLGGLGILTLDAIGLMCSIALIWAWRRPDVRAWAAATA
jgi:hypothetical protein